MSDDQFRAYQLEDAGKLSGRARAYLAHDPGLGKTRTALLAAKLAGVRSVAVVCPAIVADHWRAEARLVAPELQLHVDSYQRLVLTQAARMAFAGRDLLIMDEAHFLKTRDSRRTKLFLGSDDGLALRFPRVWPVSGTPMPRHPGELFPILYALWRPKLTAYGIKTYMEFLNHFTWYRVTQFGPKVYSAKNVPQLRLLLADVLIRRTVAQAAPDLPALRWGVLTVTAPDLRAVLEEQSQIDPGLLAALDRGELPQGDGTRHEIAKLRHAIGDLKVHAVVDLLKQELDDDPTTKRVVYAWHHSVLDVLERDLHRYGVVRVDGTLSAAAKLQRVESFVRSPRVFVAQIAAAGVGLDGLQRAAHEVVIVEPEWNSDMNVQAARRLARIGQAHPVQVRMIALAGTIDEALVRGHYREANMRQEVTDGYESDEGDEGE